MKTNFFSFRVLQPLAFALLIVLSNGLSLGDDESDRDKKSDTVLAIVGGDIHPVTGPVIRQGTLLIKDGKILEMGQSVDVPKDATVIDATGKIITPGFVAINMRGVGVRSTPTGSNKLSDSLDPFDQNLKYSLGIGITTGCIEFAGGRGGRRRRRSGEPEQLFLGLEQPVQEYVTEAMLDYGDLNTSLCPCCGLPVLPTEPVVPARPTAAQPRKMAVLKMSYGDLKSMLVKESVFYSPAPGALNGALQRHNWRRDIGIAKQAIANKKKAADKPKTSPAAGSNGGNGGKSGDKKEADAKKPTTNGSAGRRTTTKKPTAKPELIALLNHETAMRVRANTVDEINDMVDLAQELDYDLVIEGGVEAWVLAEKLGVSGVSVIFTPRQRREPQSGREESSGSFVESPKVFHESGVPFAVASLSNSISMGGLAGRDLTSLPLEAAFAVRGGASEKTALEALTIVPARMLGIEDRVGSLEKGKDADILILNGSPLDYRTYVETAVVAGKVCYDRSKDRVFPVYDREN